MGGKLEILRLSGTFIFCFRGRELQRRLAERVREADQDSKDRNKEQEELDELKNKIFAGEYDNPTLEFEKVPSFFFLIVW